MAASLPGLEALASTKGAMTLDGQRSGACPTHTTSGACLLPRRHLRTSTRPERADNTGLKSRQTARLMRGQSASRLLCTIGTKFLWTAGGWFDYLNIAHERLRLPRGSWPAVKYLNGQTSEYSETFANWRELIDMGGLR